MTKSIGSMDQCLTGIMDCLIANGNWTMSKEGGNKYEYQVATDAVTERLNLVLILKNRRARMVCVDSPTSTVLCLTILMQNSRELNSLNKDLVHK